MTTIAGFNVSIPKGDSGGFDVVITGVTFGANDVALFTLKDKNSKTIRRDVLDIANNGVTVEFTPAETGKMAIGDYTWDLRWFMNPTYDEDDNLDGGDEVDTPHTGLRLSITGTTGDY